MAIKNKLSRLKRIEKQVKAGSKLSKEATDEGIADNDELMAAIMGAITAYIQIEQQASSNNNDKRAD